MTNPRCIRIENFNDKAIYEKLGYYVVPAADYTFELRPSLRTFILVLDYMLDLNLFKDKLATQVVRPDFVAHYFPLLCKKLSLEGIFSQNQIDLEEQEDEHDEDDEDNPALENSDAEKIFAIDEADFKGDINIYTLLKNKFADLSNTEGIHSFKNSVHHSEYSFNYPQNRVFIERIVPLIKESNFEITSLEHRLIITHLLSNNLDDLPRNAADLTTLFVLPLLNGQYVRQNVLINFNYHAVLLKNPSLLYALGIFTPDWYLKQTLLKLWINFSDIQAPANKTKVQSIRNLIIKILEDPLSSQPALQLALVLQANLNPSASLAENTKDFELNFTTFNTAQACKVFIKELLNVVKNADQPDKLKLTATIIIAKLYSYHLNTFKSEEIDSEPLDTFIDFTIIDIALFEKILKELKT